MDAIVLTAKCLALDVLELFFRNRHSIVWRISNAVLPQLDRSPFEW